MSKISKSHFLYMVLHLSGPVGMVYYLPSLCRRQLVNFPNVVRLVAGSEPPAERPLSMLFICQELCDEHVDSPMA